ncbi:hypothetical protein CPB86DRAFT_878461, partial [Serendipita vermifera]
MPIERKVTKRTLLLLCLVWLIGIIIISYTKRLWRPQPCTTLEDVSGYYGPGAYWAWLLTTLSAAASTLSKADMGSISMDFIASSVYVIAAMGDFQFRLCLGCDIKSDFQAQAALHIISVSGLCNFIFLSMGEWKFRGKVDRGPLSSGKWVLWRTLLSFITIESISRIYWVQEDRDFGPSVSVLLLFGLMLLQLYIFRNTTNSWIQRALPYWLVCLLLGTCTFKYQRDERLYAWLLSPPPTQAKFSDMDQIVPLAATMLALSAQWKVWTIPTRIFGWLKKSINRDGEATHGDMEEHLLPI